MSVAVKNKFSAVRDRFI